MAYLENQRHELFAREYLKDFNEVQAAVRAGYARKSAYATGPRLLVHEGIAARIKELNSRRLHKVAADAEDVVRKLVAAVDCDVNELVQVRRSACRSCWPDSEQVDEDQELDPNPECKVCRGDGVPHVHVNDTRLLSEGAQMLYAGAKQTKDGIEVKLNDKLKLLEMLGRHLSMFTDRQEVNVTGDLAQRLIESRKVTGK